MKQIKLQLEAKLNNCTKISVDRLDFNNLESALLTFGNLMFEHGQNSVNMPSSELKRNINIDKNGNSIIMFGQDISQNNFWNVKLLIIEKSTTPV